MHPQPSNPSNLTPPPHLAPAKPARIRLLPLSAFAGLAIASLFGCRKSPPPTPDAERPATYAVTGVVQEIRPNLRTAIIDHDLIPGYMMAMTMPFETKNPQELSSLTPGDQITFRLLVTQTDAWIDQVQPTGQRRAVSTPATDPELTLIEELDIGDPIPDCTLTNDLGQSFQLSDLRGQTVALTFLFTRCPLPTYCPLMSRNFAAVAAAIRSTNFPSNPHLLTISFDPDFDTPKVLSLYAHSFRPDPQLWTFATGDREAVENLGRQFGLILVREEGTISHNLRTVVVDSAGVIRNIFRDNSYTVTDLLAALTQAAATTPANAAYCRLTITGMSCEACALTIQGALRQQPGVDAASVNLTNHSADISYDPTRTSVESLIGLVTNLHYHATLASPP